MKRVQFIMIVCLIGIFGFISCNRGNAQSASDGATNPQSVSVNEPIVINWEEFDFHPSHNVPGTIFQADFLWNHQDGERINARGVNTPTGYSNFHKATQLYDFNRDEPVTIVFRITSRHTPKLQMELLSINPTL